MRAKKIEQFIKSYFYFSQSERKGIIGLLVLISFILLLPSVYNAFFSKPIVPIQVETIPSLIPALSKSSVTGAQLFLFDPNNATEAQLTQLGLTQQNIQTLVNFRKKGGRFNKPNDLSKIYGIKPQVLESLLPFVQITDPKQSFIKSGIDTGTSKSKKQPTLLELNSADTNQLIALYRIGPAMARRIVEYRTKLGGFLRLEQLIEIYGFDEDVLYDLKGKIYVDPLKATLFDINTVRAENLKTHPYYKYKLSNAIVNYRQQHGPYHQLTELKNIAIVNDSIYANIIQYLYVK